MGLQSIIVGRTFSLFGWVLAINVIRRLFASTVGSVFFWVELLLPTTLNGEREGADPRHYYIHPLSLSVNTSRLSTSGQRSIRILYPVYLFLR